MKINNGIISFFSGALGLDLGLEKAGFELLAAVDNDKFVITGNELPSEFISYYKQLTDSLEVSEIPDFNKAIPKILFILRYEESRAILLLEMYGTSPENNPWQTPDLDEQENCLELYNDVGHMHDAFSSKVSFLFENGLRCDKDFVFYGFGDSYMWACPALNISVHGYDKDLVRSCANMQVLHIKSLFDSGLIELTTEAQSFLDHFQQNPLNVCLSPDSEPDKP
jgi:hypothetical protein